jgi:hypothetical protein
LVLAFGACGESETTETTGVTSVESTAVDGEPSAVIQGADFALCERVSKAADCLDRVAEVEDDPGRYDVDAGKEYFVWASVDAPAAGTIKFGYRYIGGGEPDEDEFEVTEPGEASYYQGWKWNPGRVDITLTSSYDAGSKTLKVAISGPRRSDGAKRLPP